MDHGSFPVWGGLAFLGLSLWCFVRCGSLWWSRRKIERHQGTSSTAAAFLGDGVVAAALAAEPKSRLGELRAGELSRALVASLGAVLLGYSCVSCVAAIPVVAFGLGTYGPVLLLSGCTLAIILAGLADCRSATILPPGALVALLAFGGFATLAGAKALHALVTCAGMPTGLLLWHSRAVSLSSGVSPLVPLFFGWLALYFGFRTRHRLISSAPLAFYCSDVTKRPFGLVRPALNALTDANLDERASSLWAQRTWLLIFVPVAVATWLLHFVYRSPLDGRWLSWVLLGVSALTTATCIWALAQAVRMGSLLDEVLRLLLRSSLATELKDFWGTLPKGRFGRLQTLAPSVDVLAEAFNRWCACGKTPDQGLPEPLRRARYLEGIAQLKSDLAVFGSARAFGSESFESLHTAVQVVAQGLREDSLPETARSPAREMLGYYLVFLVSWTLSFIWALLVLAGVEALCLLLLFATYPQEPHQLLTAYSWLLIGGSLLVSVVAMFKVERNEALSLMSRTEIGKTTFDSVVMRHLGALLAGPLVAFLFLEFPGFARWLAEWAQPLLHGLK